MPIRPGSRAILAGIEVMGEVPGAAEEQNALQLESWRRRSRTMLQCMVSSNWANLKRRTAFPGHLREINDQEESNSMGGK